MVWIGNLAWLVRKYYSLTALIDVLPNLHFCFVSAMWLANFVAIAMIKYWEMSSSVTLGKIWWALAAFMGTQVLTGALRFQSKKGCWKLLRAEK